MSVNVFKLLKLKLFFSVVPQTNVIVSSENTKETKHEDTPLENLLSK